MDTQTNLNTHTTFWTKAIQETKCAPSLNCLCDLNVGMNPTTAWKTNVYYIYIYIYIYARLIKN